MSAPTMPLNYIGVSELLTLAKMLPGFEIKKLASLQRSYEKLMRQKLRAGELKVVLYKR